MITLPPPAAAASVERVDTANTKILMTLNVWRGSKPSPAAAATAEAVDEPSVGVRIESAASAAAAAVPVGAFETAAAMSSMLLGATSAAATRAASAAVVAATLVAEGGAPIAVTDLKKQALQMGDQLAAHGDISNKEAVSTALFATGIDLAESRGLLDGTLEERRDFHGSLQEILVTLTEINSWIAE